MCVLQERCLDFEILNVQDLALRTNNDPARHDFSKNKRLPTFPKAYQHLPVLSIRSTCKGPSLSLNLTGRVEC